MEQRCALVMKMERMWEELSYWSDKQVGAGRVQSSKEESFIRPCTEPSGNNSLRRFAAFWMLQRTMNYMPEERLAMEDVLNHRCLTEDRSAISVALGDPNPIRYRTVDASIVEVHLRMDACQK